MSVAQNVVIVGGHGKVALRLARLLGPNHKVTSIIRDPAQSTDIVETGASPLVLSLEEATIPELSDAFRGAEVVVFAAGGGGKGGEERTKTVDYEGAIKVFDAIEGTSEMARPRLVLISAVDIRDENKIPPHYNDEDIAMSKRVRGAIPAYMKWKYEADKNLVARTAFKWTILRPGGLKDDAGTGKADIGRTHITTTISRDDVAQVLALLIERPDAAGLAIDLVGGDNPIPEALDKMIKKGETDWLG